MNLPIISSYFGFTSVAFALLFSGSIFNGSVFGTRAVAESQKKKKDADFEAFIKMFPKRDLPYKLGAAEMNAWIEQRKAREAAPSTSAPFAKAAASEAMTNTSIGTQFEAFIPALRYGQFSRVGPDVFRPTALLSQTNQSILMVYSRSRGYANGYKTYFLATYSPKGKRIDETEIARSRGYDGFLGCEIKKTAKGELLVAVQENVNKWKNDTDKYGKDNYIVATTVKTTSFKTVAPNGKIKAMAQP